MGFEGMDIEHIIPSPYVDLLIRRVVGFVSN
jgi:hypothetical protein